jgi:hypothetical protein
MSKGKKKSGLSRLFGDQKPATPERPSLTSTPKPAVPTAFAPQRAATPPLAPAPSEASRLNANPDASHSAVIGAATRDTPGALTSPSAATDNPLIPELVRALYRVLLLRDPDPSGFAAHIKQAHAGVPVEDLMRRFLASHEFAQKQTRFLQTYFRPIGSTVEQGPSQRIQSLAAGQPEK